MEHLTLIIPGSPVPKGRPRFTKTGHTYTDAKTRNAENAIASAWRMVSNGRPPHDGAIHVRMQCVFPIPASWPKWKRELAASSEGRVPYVGRPDIDNLIKILDGLNGLAWIDDSQIINITARKDYGPEPVTRIFFIFHPVKQLSKGSINE